MRSRIPFVVVLALFVAVSCDQQPPTAPNDGAAVTASPLFKSAKKPGDGALLVGNLGFRTR